MRFSVRLLASLRTTLKRRSPSHSSHAFLHRSAFPVASASTALAGLLLVAEESGTLRDAPRQHPFSLYEKASEPRFSLASLRDVPLAVSNTVKDNYKGLRTVVNERVNSEGGVTILKIIVANVGVYLLWKAAPTAFMVRFGPEVADILGAHRFYLFYGTSGIASSLASLTFRRITKSNVLSLGASGAVVSVLWLYACFYPDRRMSFFGTDKTLTMQELVMAYTVIDAAGLLGSLGKIDFAAHLGGAFFANSWFYLVRDKLVREQAARHRSESPNLFDNILKANGHSKHE